MSLDTALVVAVHGRHAWIETPARKRLLAHTRGRHAEVVVGDLVSWQPSGDEATIEAVTARRNLLWRQDAARSKRFAANLDAVLVLVATDPPFGEQPLARALIAAHAAGVPAWVGLNKTDLPAQAAREKLGVLGPAGTEVVELSLRDAGRAREELGRRLRGRTTLIMGPSGAGKSTLVNLLVPQAQAQVGEVSRALNAGRHTTSATTWYWLGDEPQDGAILDSPGFQEFGLHHIQPESLPALMPDVGVQASGCRFHNCSHRQEPGCRVIEAVTGGALARSRWQLYAGLFDELEAARSERVNRGRWQG